MAYAKDTEVPFERSVSEIVQLLKKADADRIAQEDARRYFTIQFMIEDRVIRFRVEYLTESQVTERTGPRQDPVKVAEQWRRQRGRALLLVIKAKLESIESGVETFEQAFLANIVLADDKTVYDRINAPIAKEYASGKVSGQLLLGGPGA